MSMASLTWLRPEWLWALLPLLVVALMWWKRSRARSAWESFVDPDLQPFVLDAPTAERRLTPLWLFVGWMLSIVLLAGPVWEQQSVPVYKAGRSSVVLFDLSRSMLTDDIPPDRLTRARFKLTDLLGRNQGGQTGLIAFARKPYVISPLTEDADNIQAFVPSLHPDIMPAQGGRLDEAIDQAVALLSQAAISQGHIIAITDTNVSASDMQAASRAKKQGHRLSVLAIGTTAGAPLKDDQGQFVQRQDGSVVVPGMDFEGMQSLAQAGGGVAVKLTTNNADLDAIDRVSAAIDLQSDITDSVSEAVYWVEYAPWGLWVLVLLLLGAFRRDMAL